MKIAIITFFALVTGFGSAHDEQSSQLLRGGLTKKYDMVCNAADGPLKCMAKQESGTKAQRLSACCGAFNDDGYMCPSSPGVAAVVYCCDRPTLRQFNDGTPTTIGNHKGCIKVVVPHIDEKENDATVVDSFMTDINSVYAEVAEGQQDHHKKSGTCGLNAQAEWAKYPTEYTEVKEFCMCMNQKCCGGYNKCEANRATCTSNGFNCVQQTLDDVFSGVLAYNVCDKPKYSGICTSDEDEDFVAIQEE